MSPLDEIGTHGGICIRPPSDPERRACRMLVPEAFEQAAHVKTLIAVTNEPLRFLGAAAFAPFQHDGKPIWHFWLRVAHPRRRQGVGTQLAEAVIDAARRRGIAALEILFSLDQSAQAEPFLRSLGFAPAAGVTTFEADHRPLLALLRSLRDRIVARGKVPENARIVPLQEVPFEQVVRLHAQYIGNTREFFLSRSPQAIKRDILDGPSMALVVDGAVQGILLAELKDGVSTIHARVVAPAFQGRWANAALMAAAFERAVQMSSGEMRIRFLSSDQNRDTLKLAKRAQAVGVDRRDCYRLSLTP